MARKKVTVDQMIEEGNGALIPTNKEKSSASGGDELSKKGRRAVKRGRVSKKPTESFKKSLAEILNTVIAPETVAEAVKSTPLGDKITYQEAILIAQVLKASNGDTQAAVFLRDTSGNKLKDAVDKELDIKTFEDF